jgi:ribosomal-protein-alanine N-acetyltransferase
VGTETDSDIVPPITTRRLELVSMSLPFMHALLAGDRAAAGVELGAIIPAGLRDGLDSFLGYRIAQLTAEPAVRQWIGRAMVLVDATGARRMIGIVGFHGAPDEERRLEIGYSVHPSHRRQGYAREAVVAMFDWAAREHGIHRFVASVSPTNEASLSLVRSLGFEQVGEQMDEIDGLELVFEGNWPRQ